MRLAVADAGPLHYLVLIGEAGVLPELAQTVLIPPEVRNELDRQGTPPSVRAWMMSSPTWLEVREVPDPDSALSHLDPGERAAITLASAVGAEAVLLDDRAGTIAARARGHLTFGTLGVLQRGARRGLLDLPAALARFTATNFHVRRDLVELLLAEGRERRRGTP